MPTLDHSTSPRKDYRVAERQHAHTHTQIPWHKQAHTHSQIPSHSHTPTHTIFVATKSSQSLLIVSFFISRLLRQLAKMISSKVGFAFCHLSSASVTPSTSGHWATTWALTPPIASMGWALTWTLKVRTSNNFFAHLKTIFSSKYKSFLCRPCMGEINWLVVKKSRWSQRAFLISISKQCQDLGPMIISPRAIRVGGLVVIVLANILISNPIDNLTFLYEKTKMSKKGSGLAHLQKEKDHLLRL